MVPGLPQFGDHLRNGGLLILPHPDGGVAFDGEKGAGGLSGRDDHSLQFSTASETDLLLSAKTS